MRRLDTNGLLRNTLIIAIALFTTVFMDQAFADSLFTESTDMRNSTVSNFNLNVNRPANTSRGYNPTAYGTLNEEPINSSHQIPEALHADYQKLQRFYAAKNRAERYVFLNKYNSTNGNFDTYVIDMQKGAIADQFVSLVGYRGFGCGKGQTRTGIFRLSSAAGRGASRKSHWGNNHRYQVITNIGGHSSEWGGSGCGQTYQHVAHSNKYITKNSSLRTRGRRRGRSRKSAGCFVTSPKVFIQWTSRVAGDALIYNVNPKSN